jgi:hypothetical protein
METRIHYYPGNVNIILYDRPQYNYKTVTVSQLGAVDSAFSTKLTAVNLVKTEIMTEESTPDVAGGPRNW